MSTGKDSRWFPHDSDALDDPKIMLLVMQLGMEGYGLYWMIVESLMKQPGYILPVSLIEPISRRHQVSKEKLECIISKFGLFESSGDYFYSPSLTRRMEVYDRRKKTNRENVLRRWHGDENTTAIRSYNDRNTKTKQNKTKQNKTKQKTTKENIIEDKSESSSGSVPSPDPLLLNNYIIKLYTWIEMGKLPGTHERVFPERFLPKTDKQKKNWLECLDKLHRLDHCTLQEINGAIIFAREDPFWKDNFLSLMKLRDKDKDGVKYIDRFITGYEKKYKSRKPKN